MASLPWICLLVNMYFKYHAPGLTAGLYISALCIIVFLILLAFRLIHESKKNV